MDAKKIRDEFIKNEINGIYGDYNLASMKPAYLNERVYVIKYLLDGLCERGEEALELSVYYNDYFILGKDEFIKKYIGHEIDVVYNKPIKELLSEFLVARKEYKKSLRLINENSIYGVSGNSENTIDGNVANNLFNGALEGYDNAIKILNEENNQFLFKSDIFKSYGIHDINLESIGLTSHDRLLIVKHGSLEIDESINRFTFVDLHGNKFFFSINKDIEYVLSVGKEESEMADSLLICSNVQGSMSLPLEWQEVKYILCNNEDIKVIDDISRPYTKEMLRERFKKFKAYNEDNYLFDRDGKFNRNNIMGYYNTLRCYFDWCYDDDKWTIVSEVPQWEDLPDSWFMSSLSYDGDEWFMMINYASDQYLLKWYQIGRAHIEEIFKNGKLITEDEYVDLINKIVAVIVDTKDVTEEKFMKILEDKSCYKTPEDNQ